MTTTVRRPQPFLVPEYCKGCGRCVASCSKGCISLGTEIQPLTGLVPIVLDLTDCNGCGLCIDACPEPFGLRPDGEQGAFAPVDPALLGGDRPFDVAAADDIPDRIVPLPPLAPLVVKGTYASAVGAVLAGCRHVFGYPITPSTEGAELSTSASKLDPRLKRFDMDDLDARVYRAPPRASVAMSGGARSSGGVRARS